MAPSLDRKAAFPLPTDVSPEEAETLAELLSSYAASRDPAEGTVELVEVRALGIEGPSATEVLLVVSGLTGAWFTKKWVDEYVWPMVRNKIDRPSKSLVEWLDKTVAALTNQKSNDG